MLVYPRVFYIILHYIPRSSGSLRHSSNTFIFMGRLSVYSNHLLTWNSKDGFDDLLHLGKFWIPEIENDISTILWIYFLVLPWAWDTAAEPGARQHVFGFHSKNEGILKIPAESIHFWMSTGFFYAKICIQSYIPCKKKIVHIYPHQTGKRLSCAKLAIESVYQVIFQTKMPTIWKLAKLWIITILNR